MSLRHRALNPLSVLCLAHQLTHNSYTGVNTECLTLISNNSILLSVVGVSLSEYGTYHMLCGIGVWYRGILTSTSTGAQYRARCIPS